MALWTPLVATIVFWPVTILSGPGVLVFAAMKWKKPLSLVRKSRWRFVVALLLGFSQTALWTWLIIFWWESFRMGLTQGQGK